MLYRRSHVHVFLFIDIEERMNSETKEVETFHCCSLLNSDHESQVDELPHLSVAQ